MNRLFQLAGVVLVLFGLAYLASPRRVYHFGLESLRDMSSPSSEPSQLIVWTYRFIGGCLVVMGISYLV
jgi:uncharacterized membrane protein HdeD (DUF308 family)